MRKLALGGVAILAAAACVLAIPIFGDKSERMAIAALLMSVYALVISGAQAFFAKDQADSARRQADAAELANTRDELTSLNLAEPEFQWMKPTGSRDRIDISFRNIGGLVQLTWGGVRSGNADIPLEVPGQKILSGETVQFYFKPPADDPIYPLTVTLQFRDCFKKLHQSIARCERMGEEFQTP